MVSIFRFDKFISHSYLAKRKKNNIGVVIIFLKIYL